MKTSKLFAGLGVVMALGVACVPLSSYAETDGSVDIKVEVGSTASITVTPSTTSAIALNQNAKKEDGLNHVVTATGNSGLGYTITLADADTDTALNRMSGSSADGTNKIPAITGASGIASFTAGTAAWGYRVGTSGNWKGVPASSAPVQIATNSTSTDLTATVYYGFATGATQVSGTYQDTVVYHVSANTN